MPDNNLLTDGSIVATAAKDALSGVIRELPVRGQILNKAMDATIKSRNQSYGAPTPNLECAAKMIDIFREAGGKRYSAAHNQAIYMAIHKLARIACGAMDHEDNYVDAAAYVAIARECQVVATRTLKGVMSYDTIIEEQNKKAALSVLDDGIKATKDYVNGLDDRVVPGALIEIPKGWEVCVPNRGDRSYFLLNDGKVYELLEIVDKDTYRVRPVDSNLLESKTLIKRRSIVSDVCRA